MFGWAGEQSEAVVLAQIGVMVKACLWGCHGHAFARAAGRRSAMVMRAKLSSAAHWKGTADNSSLENRRPQESHMGWSACQDGGEEGQVGGAGAAGEAGWPVAGGSRGRGGRQAGR
jgi:hypothetical protein